MKDMNELMEKFPTAVVVGGMAFLDGEALAYHGNGGMELTPRCLERLASLVEEDAPAEVDLEDLPVYPTPAKRGRKSKPAVDNSDLGSED